jgi:hypothetical protein
MFSHETLTASTNQARLEGVRAELRALAMNGELFITDLLMQVEPFKTLGCASIDGHVFNGGAPSVDESMKIPVPEVRLLSFGDRPMTYKRPITRRIPGTNQFYPQEWEIVNVGDDATLPHAIARNIMFKHGFPNRNARRRSGERLQGTVVEVAWLEREAAKADCLPEIKELYQRLLPRINKNQPTAKAPKAQPAQASL